MTPIIHLQLDKFYTYTLLGLRQFKVDATASISFRSCMCDKECQKSSLIDEWVNGHTGTRGSWEFHGFSCQYLNICWVFQRIENPFRSREFRGFSCHFSENSKINYARISVLQLGKFPQRETALIRYTGTLNELICRSRF